MSYTTIRIYESVLDANLIRAKFENEGITCFLLDENLVAMDPLLSNAIGGIKLKIHESDRIKAEEILESIKNNKITNDEGDTLSCPKCDSQEFIPSQKSMKSFKGILSAIISILLLTYPIFYDVKNVCKKCNHEFN